MVCDVLQLYTMIFTVYRGIHLLRIHFILHAVPVSRGRGVQLLQVQFQCLRRKICTHCGTVLYCVVLYRVQRYGTVLYVLQCNAVQRRFSRASPKMHALFICPHLSQFSHVFMSRPSSEIRQEESPRQTARIGATAPKCFKNDSMKVRE